MQGEVVLLEKAVPAIRAHVRHSDALHLQVLELLFGGAHRAQLQVNAHLAEGRIEHDRLLLTQAREGCNEHHSMLAEPEPVHFISSAHFSSRRFSTQLAHQSTISRPWGLSMLPTSTLAMCRR